MSVATGSELVPFDDIPADKIAAMGKPINGPAALTGDWVRFWHLTFNIAKTDWKLRFFGSVLGYFWQLVRPLLLFGVLYVFFTKIAHIGQGMPTGKGQVGEFEGVQLLAGIVLFQFFSDATAGAVRGVVDQEALVRKIQFPRLAIPLAATLVAVFNLGLNLLVVFVFALASGVTPMLSWVELPLILLALIALAAGWAMLLSSLFVYFRDIQPIWEVVLQVAFYASTTMIPMYYVTQSVHGALLRLFMLNPLVVCFEQFRHAVITHGVYGPSSYFGWGWVAIDMALIGVVLGLGFYVFNRTAPFVAENI